MTRVAVTGGSGKLGRAVVADLVGHGYDVVNLDRILSADPLSPFVRVDLADYGQTLAALLAVDDKYDSIDAVVHLAAIPAPGLTTNAATFDNNITSSYHVFAAARAAKIKTVVCAAALHPGRRGIPPAAGFVVFVGQGPGGGNGRAVLPVGSGSVDDRPAVLERDGTGRLLGLSGFRQGCDAADVESVGVYRCP
jgi:NAD(P)-dependent dehydrogenase (short-subunit alcohol dehydrogenase family)